MKPGNVFILSAIIAAVLTRVLPHPWNFTPIVGIALFGAAKFQNRWLGFVAPLLAMFLSDILVNFTVQREFSGGWSYFVGANMLAVYGSFIAVAFIGRTLKKHQRTHHIILASLVSSFVFYFLSNSIAYLADPLFGPVKTFSGWYACLVAGIPFYPNQYGTLLGSFFWNQFMGDLFFTGILFGAYAWAAKYTTAKAKA